MFCSHFTSDFPGVQSFLQNVNQKLKNMLIYDKTIMQLKTAMILELPEKQR